MGALLSVVCIKVSRYALDGFRSRVRGSELGSGIEAHGGNNSSSISSNSWRSSSSRTVLGRTRAITGLLGTHLIERR